MSLFAACFCAGLIVSIVSDFSLTFAQIFVPVVHERGAVAIVFTALFDYLLLYVVPFLTMTFKVWIKSL